MPTLSDVLQETHSTIALGNICRRCCKNSQISIPMPYTQCESPQLLNFYLIRIRILFFNWMRIRILFLNWLRIRILFLNWMRIRIQIFTDPDPDITFKNNADLCGSRSATLVASVCTCGRVVKELDNSVG
jgi:hypothetical protein